MIEKSHKKAYNEFEKEIEHLSKNLTKFELIVREFKFRQMGV